MLTCEVSIFHNYNTCLLLALYDLFTLCPLLTEDDCELVSHLLSQEQWLRHLMIILLQPLGNTQLAPQLELMHADLLKSVILQLRRLHLLVLVNLGLVIVVSQTQQVSFRDLLLVAHHLILIVRQR